MGTLSYTATMSIDGYVADATGDFQWSAPGEEVFAFHIERMAAVSTEILGRTTYTLMRYWESEPDDGWGSDEREFAQRWQDLDLVVASSTLQRVELGPGRIRLVPELDRAELHRIVADAAGEVEIFGPTTASAAIRAGTVENYRFFVVPKIVGGGLRALPDDARLDLRLVEQRTFENDIVYLHYTSQ
ncbi:MAG: dihydrofolate reductase family protein [Rhodococcus sp.]|nr:dihydrofolate reductase family protein [Rhodococcus sp. (in: high G+C Gram-positive bacteria)]